MSSKAKEALALSVGKAMKRRVKIRGWLEMLWIEGYLPAPGKVKDLALPALSELRVAASQGCIVWGLLSMALGGGLLAHLLGITPGFGVMLGAALAVMVDGIDGKSDVWSALAWGVGFFFLIDKIALVYDKSLVTGVIGSVLLAGAWGLRWRMGTYAGAIFATLGWGEKLFDFFRVLLADATLGVLAALAVAMTHLCLTVAFAVSCRIKGFRCAERSSSGAVCAMVSKFSTLWCASVFCFPGTEGKLMGITGGLVVLTLLLTYIFAVLEERSSCILLSSSDRTSIVRSALLSMWLVALPTGWLLVENFMPGKFANGFAAIIVLGLVFVIKPQKDFADGLSEVWDAKVQSMADPALAQGGDVQSSEEISSMDLAEELDSIESKTDASLYAASKGCEPQETILEKTAEASSKKSPTVAEVKNAISEVELGDENRSRLWLARELDRRGMREAGIRLRASGLPKPASRFSLLGGLSSSLDAGRSLAKKIGTSWLIVGWLGVAILMGIFGNVESLSKAWGAFGALMGLFATGLKEIWRLEAFGLVGVVAAALAGYCASGGPFGTGTPGKLSPEVPAFLAIFAAVYSAFEHPLGLMQAPSLMACLVASFGAVWIVGMSYLELERVGSQGAKRYAAIVFGVLAAAAGLISELAMVGGMLYIAGLSKSRSNLADWGVVLIVGASIHLGIQILEKNADSMTLAVCMLTSGSALLVARAIISAKSDMGFKPRSLGAAALYAFVAISLFKMGAQ